MRLATVFLALLVFLPPVVAPTASAQTTGSCDLGTATAELDVSDVRARLFNTGSLFYRTGSEATYSVPQGAGVSPLILASIWIGGLMDGDLRTAGSIWNGSEFWPGPLDANANPSADCAAFDRIYVVTTEDLLAYEDGAEPTPDLAAWPVGLGAPTVDADGEPVTSDDPARVIDLAAGERPLVYGNQTAFWVMNDAGNAHLFTETDPIGLEVRVTAFSVVAEELALYQGTFYRYELVNRSDALFTDVHFGSFFDPDLGDYRDDYVGVDTTRGLGFVYNANETDAEYGVPPALGYDLLAERASSHNYFINASFPGSSVPANGAQMYNLLRGQWGSGVPITEGGVGYQTDGPITTYAFPGDPVTEQFWSEVNTDGEGGDNFVGSRYHMLATGPFEIAPGGTHTVDLAILFAQGGDRFDSITELRAASDAVQARYDAGELFVPFPPFEGDTLPTPAPVAPADGAELEGEGESVDLLFEWTAVEGADRYLIEVDDTPDFSSPQTAAPIDTDQVITLRPPPYAATTYHWRVRAENGPVRSTFTEARVFTLFREQPEHYAQGLAIVEAARPDGPVCPEGTDDFGCLNGFGGNTVWHDLDGNADADYYVSAGGGSGGLDLLLRYYTFVQGRDFEMRFTDACAEPEADEPPCFGVFAFEDDKIATVPFELWDVGDETTPEDDTRMIPFFVAAGDTTAATWRYGVGPNPWPEDTLSPISDWVYFMDPEVRGGEVSYGQFAAVAVEAGGPGAIYPTADDGSEEGYFVNLAQTEPGTGQEFSFVYPVGRFVLADLAGDGTPPPVGTVIRLHSLEPFAPVDDEDGPAQPDAFALNAAYPNPFAHSATVEYRLRVDGEARVAVYDVLGRRVAVLAEGLHAAGPHRARFEAEGLASGVYLVVLKAGGQRTTRKLMLVR